MSAVAMFAVGHQSTHHAGNRFQLLQVVGSKVRSRGGWAWGLAGDLNHPNYLSVPDKNRRRHELLNYLCVEPGVA
jgi:hypothetical protein